MSYLNNFYHQFYGPETGRKWIFVHGLMGYGQNWRKIVAGLESTERCFVYDQRGHGRSFHPTSGGYAPEDYAQDLLKIVDELGWETFNLVGHSMGGRNVLNFAALHPERIDHLVIEDIGPEGAENAHEYYEYLLNSVPTPFQTRAEAKAYFFETFIHNVRTRERAEVMANYFYSNMAEQPDGTVSWRFDKQGIINSVKMGRGGDRWAEVRALKCPTLWIRGENSKEFSFENYQRVLESNPLIQGIEIPGAGHWVHADQPQAFLQALKDFVGGF